MKRELVAADILSAEDYERIRPEKRGAIIAMKKNRRVAVGPYATFYFENYDTMWLQVQEMLRIEKGGAEQLQDELHAYTPLVPKGNELIATVMLEIEDEKRRAAVLATLGGIQEAIELRFGGDVIKAEAERDLDYTSAEGKASSVQFVHFRLTPSQILKFRAPNAEIILAVTHANYGHMAVVPEHVRQELARDFIS
jgi:hypothetical protein